MKIFNIIISGFAIGVMHFAPAKAQERQYDYTFFENSALGGDYFFSKVKYAKGSYVKNIRGRLPVSEEQFFTPPNAIEPTVERDNGTLAPTGALASFPYTPEQSMAALRNMYRNHGKHLWGEYGFKDAVNLEENWQARIYMGLNQAPVTVMIENYRTGLIWKLFMQNEEIKKVLEQIKN